MTTGTQRHAINHFAPSNSTQTTSANIPTVSFYRPDIHAFPVTTANTVNEGIQIEGLKECVVAAVFSTADKVICFSCRTTDF